ncbi:Protein-tyrosine phosphatase containing protein [Ditylenchus destructor]|uniref:Protein-tyrosine phosphatase containing protein n=1 Tax=Ditylenchus destructor TaxID=166010 RepID=A0AAD4R2P8_9BILA|nr:Protein-tyrosine phosphatase containing protein [Ditylenchus destructor]
MACYELIVKGNRSFAVNEVVCRLRDQRTQSVKNDLQHSFVYRITLEILLAEKLIEKSRDLSQFFEDFDVLNKRKKS